MTSPLLPLPEVAAPADDAVADVEPAPESANAPAVAAVSCTNPTCGHRGQRLVIHADTIQPVHCGGCFGVLHCDHEPETTQVREGTLGAPVLRTTTSCGKCRTVHSESREPMPPIDLNELPASILDQPLEPGRIV